jgi:hypothetical protein
LNSKIKPEWDGLMALQTQIIQIERGRFLRITDEAHPREFI